MNKFCFRYIGDAEESLLCKLSDDLNQLSQEEGLTTVSYPVPVDCAHNDNPTSSQDLCELWCQIEFYKGNQCIECPDKYSPDPEYDLLCSLWSDLQMMLHNATQIPSSMIGSQTPSSMTESQTPTSMTESQTSSSMTESQIPSSMTESEEPTSMTESEQPSSVTESKNITCQYAHHDTSSAPLCELWCEIKFARFFWTALYST